MRASVASSPFSMWRVISVLSFSVSSLSKDVATGILHLCLCPSMVYRNAEIVNAHALRHAERSWTRPVFRATVAGTIILSRTRPFD
jgi:hypothetical protein